MLGSEVAVSSTGCRPGMNFAFNWIFLALPRRGSCWVFVQPVYPDSQSGSRRFGALCCVGPWRTRCQPFPCSVTGICGTTLQCSPVPGPCPASVQGVEEPVSGTVCRPGLCVPPKRFPVLFPARHVLGAFVERKYPCSRCGGPRLLGLLGRAHARLPAATVLLCPACCGLWVAASRPPQAGIQMAAA